MSHNLIAVFGFNSMSFELISQLIAKQHTLIILDEVVFGRADLNTVEISIPDHSSLDQTYARELQLNKKYNLFLMGVVDKEMGDNLYFALSE